MGKLIERCAGIDIGKRFLVRCVMTGAAQEEPGTETRRFDTTVPGLKRLLAPRRGEKRAIIAVAHHMLIILYCMLKRGVPFLGAEHAPKHGGGNVVLSIACDALGVSVSR